MWNRSIEVACPLCGLASRRPASFVRARRSFICGGCLELIPFDDDTLRTADALLEGREAAAGAEERAEA